MLWIVIHAQDWRSDHADMSVLDERDFDAGPREEDINGTHCSFESSNMW